VPTSYSIALPWILDLAPRSLFSYTSSSTCYLGLLLYSLLCQTLLLAYENQILLSCKNVIIVLTLISYIKNIDMNMCCESIYDRCL
jgi:hypothetical protein